jgi:hypothetical protein
MSADSIEKIADEIESAAREASSAHGYCHIWPSTIEPWIERLRALPSLAELERDAERLAHEALGFAFAYACSLLDRDLDPRQHEIPRLLEEWNTARANEAQTK